MYKFSWLKLIQELGLAKKNVAAGRVLDNATLGISPTSIKFATKQEERKTIDELEEEWKDFPNIASLEAHKRRMIAEEVYKKIMFHGPPPPFE